MTVLSRQTLEASSDLFGAFEKSVQSEKARITLISALNHIKKTFVRRSRVYARFFGHTHGVKWPIYTYFELYYINTHNFLSYFQWAK